MTDRCNHVLTMRMCTPGSFERQLKTIFLNQGLEFEGSGKGGRNAAEQWTNSPQADRVLFVSLYHCLPTIPMIPQSR